MSLICPEPSTSKALDAVSCSTESLNKISEARTRYCSQLGPHHLCRHLSSGPETTESPTRSNRNQSDLFGPYNLPYPLPTNNTHPLPKINKVIQGLQRLACHVHFEANNRLTGCLVYGKSYDQVFEETASDISQQTAESGETIRNRHKKIQAVLASLQCGVLNFPLIFPTTNVQYLIIHVHTYWHQLNRPLECKGDNKLQCAILLLFYYYFISNWFI